jgi:acylphosphatase
VRNLPDGRVEVLASGDDGPVDVLEGRLWQGPPHARVAGVEMSPAEAPAHAEFRVRSTEW